MKTIEHKTFERIHELEKADYDNCQFKECNFSNGDLSETRFVDCEFTDCNLLMANISKTMFADTKFTGCKMYGLKFETCAPFMVFRFDNCLLNHSSFYQTKIKHTVFKNCSLHDVDFAEADLGNAVFEECDLLNALFDNTNLEKADMRSAYNLSINPDHNKIRKAKFSLVSAVGLLTKYDIVIEGRG